MGALLLEWFPDFLLRWYPWIKALHIISVIAWMACLLYLPRLFVYHVDTEVGSVQSQTFKVMEKRLIRAIMNPAMLATWSFGLLLIYTPGVINWHDGWPWAKGTLVILLSAIHGMLTSWSRAFAANRNQRSARFYRLVNEAPMVLLIAIVILVVVRPF